MSAAPLPVVVIAPSRRLLALDLAAVWHYRELLLFLISREMKVRYRQAAIGVGWAVIQPVFAAALFAVVFGHFARIPSDGFPYLLFAFTALLPWNYFSEAVRRGSTGLVDDSDLVRKVYFPRLVIPLAMVVAPLVDFAVSFVVLLVLVVWYGIVPGWHVVFLPVFLLQAVLMALAVSLWLGPFNVRFRDIKHVIPFLLQLWMYASPVVYALSIVPPSWRAWYSVNPMVGVIEGFRWALLGTPHPDLTAMAVGWVLVLCAMGSGLIYFKRREREFADVI